VTAARRRSGAGPADRSPRPVGAVVLAGLLLVLGVLHLAVPRPFDAIIPRALPAASRRPLTYASGAAELVCGALLLVPRTRRLGGWLTAALLLAVWPANVDAALRGGYPGLSGFAGSAAAAWLRVPLQLPLLWVALRTARRSPRT
jgi:uncharacterized membrane protein